MLNNKGFTLVELLVTIALIGLAGTIIMVNMSGIQSNTDENQISKFKSKLTTAACLYIDKGQVVDNLSLDTTTTNLKLGNSTSNCTSSIKSREACKNNSNGCYVCLSTIIQEGLIDENLMDPETNVKASGETNIKVHVKWKANGSYKEKVCSFCRGTTCEE